MKVIKINRAKSVDLNNQEGNEILNDDWLSNCLKLENSGSKCS